MDLGMAKKKTVIADTATNTVIIDGQRKPMHYLPSDQVVRIPKPDGWMPELTWANGKHKNQRRCIAWNTRTGAQCEALATKRSGAAQKCRSHGGAVILRGIDSPGVKHMRYSQVLPTRMAARFVQSTNDPDLLSLQAEISLVDARIEDLLTRVDSGESGATWVRALNQYVELSASIKEGNAAGMIAWLDKLRETIDAGLSDYHNWAEIGGAIEARRKLVESERKRLIDIQGMITVTEAMALMRVLTDSIQRNVSDPTALRMIQNDIKKFTGGVGYNTFSPPPVDDLEQD